MQLESSVKLSEATPIKPCLETYSKSKATKQSNALRKNGIHSTLYYTKKSIKKYFLKKHRKQPTASGHIKEWDRAYFELAARTWLDREQWEGHRISGTWEARRQQTAPSRPLFHSEDTPAQGKAGIPGLERARQRSPLPLSVLYLVLTCGAGQGLTSHPDFQQEGECLAAAGADFPGAQGSTEPWEGVRGRNTHPAGRHSNAAPLGASFTLPRSCPGHFFPALQQETLLSIHWSGSVQALQFIRE